VLLPYTWSSPAVLSALLLPIRLPLLYNCITLSRTRLLFSAYTRSSMPLTVPDTLLKFHPLHNSMWVCLCPVNPVGTLTARKGSVVPQQLPSRVCGVMPADRSQPTVSVPAVCATVVGAMNPVCAMLLFNHNTQGRHGWVFLVFEKFARVFCC
jgi:hypothetical protein